MQSEEPGTGYKYIYFFFFSLTKDMLTAFATAMGKKEGERIIPRTAA